MTNFVRRMWNIKYPEHAREVRRRLGVFKCGMREERYPIGVRRALMLRYRESAFRSLAHEEARKERT